MLIMWSLQHYSDSPPEKEVMTSSRSEILKTAESQILPTRPEPTPGNLRGSNGNHKPFSSLEIEIHHFFSIGWVDPPFFEKMFPVIAFKSSTSQRINLGVPRMRVAVNLNCFP